MVTSEEEIVDPGNDAYRDNHLAKMFRDGFSFSGYERDGFYQNIPDGETGKRRYRDLSGISGIDSETDGRASVFADFDNDGDLDVFVTTIQDEAHLLFRNQVGEASHWVRIALQGAHPNRDAYGATVRVKTAAGTPAKIKSGGSGFLSQHDPRLLFGIGSESAVEWIEVRWPSGAVQRFPGVPAGTSWRAVEGQADLVELAAPGASLPEPLGRDAQLLERLRVKIGEPFPDLAIVDLPGGDTSSISQRLTRGRRHLVNLWATWCTPCRVEMPELDRQQEELRAAGLELLGVSVDVAESGKVAEFLETRSLTYANVQATPASLGQIYTSDEIFVPLTFVVDEEGIVRDVWSGWTPAAEARLRRWMSP